MTEGYASFSGHARIVCLFTNLATHLPKTWLSVQPGCFINSLLWFPADNIYCGYLQQILDKAVPTLYANVVRENSKLMSYS